LLGSALLSLSGFYHDFFFERIFKPKQEGVVTRLKSKDFHSKQEHFNLRYSIRLPNSRLDQTKFHFVLSSM
jgi:hypothetical protein